MSAPTSIGAALSAHGLARSFGGVQAIKDVSLSVRPGERRLIIGPNGAGKTTLFNLLSGTVPVSGGHIILWGEDITSVPPNLRANRGLRRTFQITNLFPRLSVIDNLKLALHRSGGGGLALVRRVAAERPLHDKAAAMLSDWGLADLAEKRAQQLSYGQKRLLDLLLAMAGQPKVLLLDEPTAGLSAAEVVRVVEVISRLSREMTVLMIEHDMDIAFDLADGITVLHQGQVVADGTVAQVRADPRVLDLYLGAD